MFNETTSELINVDDNTSLLTRIWMPKDSPRAVLLAIHGGMAHGGDWITPAAYFIEKGIATYAPDLRWHGTYPRYNKGGKVMFHLDSYDQAVGDVNVILRRIRDKHPGVPVFIMAHSNGALISLKYALSASRDNDIKGFILSSPWLKNKVQVSPFLVSLSKFLSSIVPMMAVSPGESLLDKLTRDVEITARHHSDEANGLRGTKVTVRAGAESMKTQEWVLANIQKWDTYPVFCVVAGRDYLADPDVSEKAIGSITEVPVEYYRYEENYHENFNELNREIIFGNVSKWIDKILGAKSVPDKKPVKAKAKPAAVKKSSPKKKQTAAAPGKKTQPAKPKAASKAKPEKKSAGTRRKKA